MVPVERLLRAHIAEHTLKPASVLEGGIIRVPVQGGRVQLRRIVGCKERGTHLELVTEVGGGSVVLGSAHICVCNCR